MDDTMTFPAISPALAPTPATTSYSRSNPFLAELVRHDRLTGLGSLKDTRHFVLNLAGSGLAYVPGDSLGTFGANSPALVDEVIGLLGFSPNAIVNDPQGRPTMLRHALLHAYTLNRANRKIMSAISERIPSGRTAQWADGNR